MFLGIAEFQTESELDKIARKLSDVEGAIVQIEGLKLSVSHDEADSSTVDNLARILKVAPTYGYCTF